MSKPRIVMTGALVSAPNAVSRLLVDAKGDLLAGTAADTAGRLAVGANGAILLADSAQTTGLKWSTTLTLEGTGSPEGVKTAPVGSRYVDTAATTGAVLWVKATGSGNTGWKVSHGDTAWRNIGTLLTANWSGSISLCRTNAGVETHLSFVQTAVSRSTGSGWIDLTAALPGFGNMGSGAGDASTAVPGGRIRVASGSNKIQFLGDLNASDAIAGMLAFKCDDDWPTSLPGS